ncbi:MAG: translation elongation factor EF-1 subunit alpha [Candidatus Woesearchaeota archaeon]|nr:translation elongation factor EF-1 subunit alpha [Candidatus Woesearchaeota archaeon]
MAKAKPHLNLVFVGHVDHGKSTTVGRLMFDGGAVDEQTMRKLKDKAAELGKAGFEFAYVMDNLKEEQERGVTIDLAHKRFDTDNYECTIIDAPGHKDFVKNMITGASQADAAVLVVAANDGVNAQTKEHVFLSKVLGVNRLVVAVNKMDISGVDYKEEKFNAVKEEVTQLLTSVGYKADDVPFIAVSSFNGENIVNKSENMSWYSGPTLLEAINAIEAPEKPTDLPFRMPIQDVYNITGIGVVPVGRIETGVLKAGDKLVGVPGREGKQVPGECKSIEMHHEQIPQAEPGDNVGISCRGFGKKDLARGDVLGHPDNVPTVAKSFTAQMVVLQHPSVITVGYTPVFHIHTAQVACRVEAIEKKLNPATGETLEENPDFIKNGDAAIVKLVPTQPLCIETKADIPQLCQFAIRDSGSTVAAGMCMSVEKKDV